MLTDSMYTYIFHLVVAKFLAMWPTMHFYLYGEQIQLPITSFFFGQLTLKLAVNYIRVVSASMPSFKSLLVVFLAIWPKCHFTVFFYHILLTIQLSEIKVSLHIYADSIPIYVYFQVPT